MVSENIPINILIADDDPAVHDITEMTLADVTFNERPVNFFRAFNGEQTVEMLTRHPDIAVIFLDVGMATETDGLDAVKTIRRTLGNRRVRIVIRTGRLATIPEKDIIRTYDINDYALKTELTSTRLYITLYSALRTYFDMQDLEAARLDLLESREKIQRNENRHKSWYQNVPVMIHSIDENGCLIDVNTHWLNTLKYTREEVIGRPSTEFLTEASRTLARTRVLPEFWKQGKVVDVPYQMVAKDGCILDVLLSATLERDPTGPHSIAVIKDITSQRQAEDALKKSEQRLNLAVKGGNLGFWDWDMRSNKVTYNSRWADIIGHSIDEIEQSYASWETRLHPDDKGLIQERLAGHINGTYPFFEAEHRLKTKEGAWRWVLGVGKISRRTRSDGAPLRMTGIMVDIDQRKQVEEKLKESEKRFRNVALASGDWIWETDADGRYTYASQGVTEILGFAPGELIGKTPFDLTGPQDTGSFREAFQAMMAQKKPVYDLEKWHMTKSGAQVCLLTNGVPLIGENGSLYGYFGVDKDITAQKNAQTEIQTTLGELTALNRLGREVNSELSLEGVLEHALVPVSEAIQPALALVFLVDDTRLVVRQSYSFDNMTLDARAPGVTEIALPLCREAFEKKIAVFTTDITRETRKVPAAPVDGPPEIRGFAAIPLIIGQETIGVLALGCLTPRPFNQRQDFLFSIAEIMAAGINNAMLHEKNQSYAEYLEKSVEQRTRELTRTNRQLKTEIEERKLMAAELEAREAMLNRTGSMARVGGWELDLATEKLAWTRAVYDIHQVEETYVPDIGTAINFYIPEHREKVNALVMACMENGTPYDGEFQMISAKGNRLWVRAKGEPVYRDGKVAKLVGSFQDISDRKKAEAELLLAKEEAENASLAKTEFLARMSHEIRTPMNAILNLTEFVLNTRLNREQEDYLKVVRQSGRHLLSVINDILDLSKIESGRMELEHAAFDLSMVLEATIASLSQQAREKGLYLETKIAKDLPVLFKGDSSRLQQILLNLTGNAIKFTRSGGIVVSVSCSDIACTSRDGKSGADTTRIQFRIEDTGIGIDDAHNDIIFQAFGQADVSTSRKYGGTGLGLTISKQIIELMGGDIWFASAPGKGTVFHFSICLEQGSTDELDREADAPDRFNTRTTPANILLAEDNAANIKVAKAMVDVLGHHMSIAKNGVEAIELLRTAAFDLVLMDVEMPVMDGIATTRKIRAGDAGENNRNIRIVALTAHALTGYREKCLAAGMDHYISKPFRLNELAAIIGRVPGSSGHDRQAPAPYVEDTGDKVLDSASAIRRLNGDLELYSSLCNDFIKKHAGQLDGLNTHIQNGEMDKAAILAHTLKGNCGNIGALECEAIAGTLETAVRRKDSATARECFDQLVKAAAEIRQVIYTRQIPETPQSTPVSENPLPPLSNADTPFRESIARLKEKLVQGREDDRLLRMISDRWPAGTDTGLRDELIENIDNFDFAQARATLEKIEQTI